MATQSVRTENCPSQDSDFIVKLDRRKDTHFLDKLKHVAQALEIESEGWLKRLIENPCVVGSISSRATKKYQNYLRVVFQ